MINKNKIDIRFKIKKAIIICISTLLLISLITCLFFFISGHSKRKAAQNAIKIALNKTPITKIDEVYHLSRDITSDSVSGRDKHNHRYYFVYIPSKNKAYYYSAKEGMNKAKISSLFEYLHPNQNTYKINFGWYKDLPVWEISYKKNNGNYGYAIYSFKTGKEIFFVDNI